LLEHLPVRSPFGPEALELEFKVRFSSFGLQELYFPVAAILRPEQWSCSGGSGTLTIFETCNLGVLLGEEVCLFL
jgi:hypothetical protein